MKKSDLYREWARVLDMCEGTVVKPWSCVRRKTDEYLSTFYATPDFDDIEGEWSFAVAILEGKPVFVGDVVYHKSGPRHIVAFRPDSLDGYSWNPPKKTFMLNGEELPCPVEAEEGWFIDIKAGTDKDKRFYFERHICRDKVADAIIKLLRENTK